MSIGSARRPSVTLKSRKRSVVSGLIVMAVIVAQAALMVGQAAGAANPAANLDQCANDPLPSPHTDGCGSSATQWVNGNLGASKSVYFEGDSIPYRMTFSNLAFGPSVPHTVTIEWDTTKSSKHAIDYLTTWNRTVANSNPCLGVNGCSLGTFDTEPITPDPQVTGVGVTPIAGVFTLFGGNITGLSAYSGGAGFPTGDNSRRITISFTSSVANPVLAWGGHISTRQQWGASNSAVTISGSPYHTRLIDLDGSGGNQDRSLSADAVIFPGSITIIKNAVPDSAQDFSFTTTGGLSPSTFSLDDDANATLSNTQTYSNILTFTTYTFTEGAVANWTLSFGNPVCTVTSANGGSQSGNVGTRTVTIGLKEGENVTCTFTNTHANNTPSIATVLADSTLTVGGSTNDTATLTGATSGAGGTVDYRYYSSSADCVTDATAFDGTVASLTGGTDVGSVTVTGGVVPDSASATFNSAGTFYWAAFYTGDANNDKASSDCTAEALVVNASPHTGQITPTATTCTQFNAGTAATLDTLNYSVKNGSISQVSPGVFFYWIKVTAVAGSNTFTINQTITTGNFDSHFFSFTAGSAVYSSTCVKQASAITQFAGSGVTSIAFNASSAGTYIIGVKYDAGSVKGFTAPSPTTVGYTFEVPTVSGSLQGLSLVKKV
jgi:hypothetical protein